MYSSKPFGEAVDELLRERYPWPRRYSLQALARDLGINYATLRSGMYGRTTPPPLMIETVANYFGVEPDYFREYRVQKVIALMEARPEFTGRLYEYALEMVGEDNERPRSKKG